MWPFIPLIPIDNSPLWTLPSNQHFFLLSTRVVHGLSTSSHLGDHWLGVHLDLGDAAVHEELDAGDIARVVGGEERDSLRNVIRIAHATQRHALCEIFFHLRERITLPPALENRRIDMAGADGVHANTAVAEFPRPGAGERAHCRLSELKSCLTDNLSLFFGLLSPVSAT